jgi:hypothetical protein
MNGGTISGNSAAVSGGGITAGGSFTMSGGTISDNSVTYSPESGDIFFSGGGGGVYVTGAFTMSNGTISGNSVKSCSGGGVFITAGGSFTMSGGTISGNSANLAGHGGGVAVGGGYTGTHTFIMSNGVISGNTARYGGGVYVEHSGSSALTRSGGTNSGNSANSGGGVHVATFHGGGMDRSGTFTKQGGGIIYGFNETDRNLRNTAINGDGYGHAVAVGDFVYGLSKKRNSTAGTAVGLNSAISGSMGGWEEIYTVSYSANSASGTTPADQTVTAGYNVTLAGQGSMTYPGYIFTGWNTSPSGSGTAYSAGDSYTPAGSSILFYAQWIQATLAELLTWIDNNAVEGGEYAIPLWNSETIAPRTLSYGGKNVKITLTGDATERTISLSSTGSLFTVESGVTLILGDKVTLRGISGNTAPLVDVTGGTLVMNTGSKISDNTNTSFYGGGVHVEYGTFTMGGGIVSGSSANSGGGVYVSDSGTFTKQGGGIIYGSDASSLKNTATSGDGYGHAVYIDCSPAKIRDITANTGDDLDSAVDGPSGGW